MPLEHQDAQERAQWVQLYRQSQRPLGEIIQEVMQQRDAHWAAERPVFPPLPPALSQKTETKQVMGGLASSGYKVMGYGPNCGWTPSLIFVQDAKLYPPEFTLGLKAWPMIEDLLQHKIFHQYREWRLQAGMPVDRQQGALAHKAALPPVVSFGLEPDDHFAASLKASSQPSPLEGFLTLDDDIHFAAEATWQSQSLPVDPRIGAIGVLKELARNRHIALVALLSLLASWPDHGLALDLVVGFPAVGYAPPCGAFAPKQVSPITLAKVLKEAASHDLALLRTIRPGQMDQFILDSGLKDAGKGFCTEPLKPAQHVWALHQAALRHGSSITQASAGMQSAGEDWRR
ncbi:unnamed protein product [Effrenium voratum]|nr:unnamed protein product [Effrenium voratum]